MRRLWRPYRIIKGEFFGVVANAMNNISPALPELGRDGRKRADSPCQIRSWWRRIEFVTELVNQHLGWRSQGSPIPANGSLARGACRQHILLATFARMMELVYLRDSKSWFCGFESHFGHHLKFEIFVNLVYNIFTKWEKNSPTGIWSRKTGYCGLSWVIQNEQNSARWLAPIH